MSRTAIAAVLTKPETFDIREMPIPDIGPDDGILRIEAGGLCGTDVEQFHGHLGGTGRDIMPIIPGHELMGHVEAVGADAARRWGVKEGDRVALEAGVPCGQCRNCLKGASKRCKRKLGYGLYRGVDYQHGLWGGYASHAYLHPQAVMHKLPDDVPTGVMSLFNPLAGATRWVYQTPKTGLGDSIVIEGPGQRGLLATLVAREAGAGTIIVTGTARDAHRLELARRLGATHTIDVDAEDPVARVADITGGEGVDIVLDISAGSTEPIVQAVDMVRPGGQIVLAGLKSNKPVTGLVTDKIVWNEIRLQGVLSSDWSSMEIAIDIIDRLRDELDCLCTHTYPIEHAAQAVRVLAREIEDGPEAVHVHLQAKL